MIMQNAPMQFAGNDIAQFDLYVICALDIRYVLFCMLDWHWSTDECHCLINLKTCRIPEVNWECIYVICIHRCHLGDSPWTTLLPHRWVQAITRMVIIIWTYVKCIKIVYITNKITICTVNYTLLIREIYIYIYIYERNLATGTQNDILHKPLSLRLYSNQNKRCISQRQLFNIAFDQVL